MAMKFNKMQTKVGTMTFKETRGDWEFDGNVMYSYSVVPVENPDAKPFFLGENRKKSLERLKTLVETVFRK